MVLHKRSMRINGHRTSVALEPEFWQAVEALAKQSRLSLPRYIGVLDDEKGEYSLASACRLAALRQTVVIVNAPAAGAVQHEAAA